MDEILMKVFLCLIILTIIVNSPLAMTENSPSYDDSGLKLHFLFRI